MHTTGGHAVHCTPTGKAKHPFYIYMETIFYFIASLKTRSTYLENKHEKIKAMAVLSLVGGCLLSFTNSPLPVSIADPTVHTPAPQLITVHWPTTTPLQSIRLLDLSGRALETVTPIRQGEYTFDFSQRPTGIYLAQCIPVQGPGYTLRLVKARK